jgi:adenylate cyclase class 2
LPRATTEPDRLIYLYWLTGDVIEVEMKFRSPGNGKVVDALRSIGAKELSDNSIDDVYFAHPSRDFGRTDEAVRLRTRGSGLSELTYKGPRMERKSAKAREELTISVDDGLAARRMLERLGFCEFVSIRKRRISFALDKLRVDVDDVEGLGQFVELELMTEDPSRAETLMEIARKELSLAEPVSETYLELLPAGREGPG